MHTVRRLALASSALTGILASSFTYAGADPNSTAPGPGLFALLALGIVGAIGIAKLRK